VRAIVSLTNAGTAVHCRVLLLGKYIDNIRSDPDRKSVMQAVRAANAQSEDVQARRKLQAVQPHAHAVNTVDNAAVYENFRPKFAACIQPGSDTPEERTLLRQALHAVLDASGPNCALFPHLLLDRFGGTCFSVSLNRIDNNLNYPPSNVQVRVSPKNRNFRIWAASTRLRYNLFRFFIELV